MQAIWENDISPSFINLFHFIFVYYVFFIYIVASEWVYVGTRTRGSGIHTSGIYAKNNDWQHKNVQGVKSEYAMFQSFIHIWFYTSLFSLFLIDVKVL